MSASVMDGHVSRVFALAYHPSDPHTLLSAGWDDTVQVITKVISWEMNYVQLCRHVDTHIHTHRPRKQLTHIYVMQIHLHILIHTCLHIIILVLDLGYWKGTCSKV